MFQTSPLTDTDSVDIIVDGNSYRVPAGISVAAALLLHNLVPFRRSLVDHSPRAPYCLMGVCCECTLQIDGVGSQLSCQVEVAQGMTVERCLNE